MSWVRWLIACLVVLCSAGCASDPGEAPAGPGATSQRDLSPWLSDAPRVTYTGRLMNFHCTSENGTFWTWSMTPAGNEDAAEVDIRACAADAQRLENRCVTITGRLIYREPRHFPILVADHISPAGTPPEALSASAAMDRELNLALGL